MAWLARQARSKVQYGALALLLVGTGFVIVAASSDAQDGLVILYILPRQWLVAAFAGLRRFSAPPDDGLSASKASRWPTVLDGLRSDPPRTRRRNGEATVYRRIDMDVDPVY